MEVKTISQAQISYKLIMSMPADHPSHSLTAKNQKDKIEQFGATKININVKYN